MTTSRGLLCALILGLAPCVPAWAFDSLSDGSDGALNLTTPGVIDFDPATFSPPLDPDGDNIYHFTTITIGAGVTVRLTGDTLGGPVYWLATGAVQIDGEVDLNGANGTTGLGFPDALPPTPGAGGFAGGLGNTNASEATQGSGPGGGTTAPSFAGGAGYVIDGIGSPGTAYGSDFLVPLIGGSGGGGALASSNVHGASGGAGGGAILIASSTTVTIDGSIRSNGGNGGSKSTSPVAYGGGGSGGSIRIAAPTIVGTGMIEAKRGISAVGNSGSRGRIRFEAFQQNFTGTSDPTILWRAPYSVHLPTNPFPTVRVTTVDGVPVADPASGSFTLPDVTIGNAGPVTVAIEGRSVPLGTTVDVTFYSDDGATQTVTSSPLAGTEASSTATASVTLPSGFSRGYARATWTP